MAVLKDFLTALLGGNFGTWLIEKSDTMGQSILASTTTYFTQAISDVCKPSYLSAITSITIPIGILIMSIYFFVDLMSKSVSANFNTEILVRSFIKFVIGYALIINCDKLAGGIISFGDALTQELVTKVTSYGFDYSFSSTAKKILLYLKDNGGFFTGMAVIFKLLIKCIAELIITFLYSCMLMTTAYSRALMIFVYRAFLPIAVADIFGKGIYAGAAKHIKRLLALTMQYPVVYIICLLSCIFMNTIDFLHTNWAAMIGQMVMIFIVIMQTIKKSKDEAMQLFG